MGSRGCEVEVVGFSENEPGGLWNTFTFDRRGRSNCVFAYAEEME